MQLKQIIDESFGDYKQASMLLVTPECTGKCEGCQNTHLAQLETKNFPDEEIWKRFEKNPFTKAIVMGGLEPFCHIDEVVAFIFSGIERGQDVPIVIYTGYEVDELSLIRSQFIQRAKEYRGPVIVKFGRYIPNQTPVYNKHLGVTLASPNQYSVIF